jgi:adenylate cyclase
MSFWHRLRQLKMMQWALAYLAGAWLLLQVVHLFGELYEWPPSVLRPVPVVLGGGFLAALITAWYHGEKGRQRVTPLEVALLGLVLVGTTVTALRAAADGADVTIAERAPIDPRSVAVLPFENISGDPAQDYFAEGITEEIMNALSQFREIRVPARTSSFHFKDRDLPMREIAAQLGVATVLLGRVRKDGRRVRISAQLVDAREDRHVWADQFDHDADDVFSAQSAIALAVSRALLTSLAADTAWVSAAPTRNATAHDLYLQGLFHWNRRSPDHLRDAIRFFEEAVRTDPSYAAAHAGLAVAHAVAPLFNRDITVSESVVRVEAAARRALDLDPSLALPHAALGYAYHWQWRWEDAERELSRAVDRNPSLAIARQWYGEHLAKLGRGEEGIEQLRQAVAIDPLSAVAHGNLGLVLLIAGREDEGIEQLERTHAMDESLSFPLLVLHRHFVSKRRIEDAVRTGRLWAELTGTADAEQVAILTRAGNRPDLHAAALDIVREWERLPAPPWTDLANYLLAMNRQDDALSALERGFRDRDPMMTTISTWQGFATIRDHPRFLRILRDMRL